MGTSLSITSPSMSMYSQYLLQQANKLQELYDTPVTKFTKVYKKPFIRDVADLTVECDKCRQDTSIIDCHEVEMIFGFDNIIISPVCPSCYEDNYTGLCLEKSENHTKKHHQN